MIADYETYDLLLECFDDVDKFTRDGDRYTMTHMEMLSLTTMLDILKPQLKELH